MTLFKRAIVPVLEQMLGYFPVVGITGPRQSGKSTLLRSLLTNYTYVTFDDPNEVYQFEADPKKYLNRYKSMVIFDEVQYVPTLFRYLKIQVDNDRDHYGQFIVTSSNQFAFLHQATESLAGRIGLLTLLPLQCSEIPEPLRACSIFKGAYPELVKRAYQFSSQWYAAYMDTYLHKDVRAIAKMGDMRDFQRLIYLLAADTSGLLNMSRYANDLGVTVATIKKWISVLEASYIIFLLPAYHQNLGKRVIKSPKVYFYDTGLVSYLTGIQNTEQYEHGPMAGGLFENHVVAEVMKKIKHSALDASLYFYRSSHGVEVDLIIDWKTHQDFIEIKSSHTFRPKMFSAIEKLMPDTAQGFLLYQGEPIQYDDRLQVMPYQRFLLGELRSGISD